MGAVNTELEMLRSDFNKIAAKYIWGSKKVHKIKIPYKHYFSTVADYFINKKYDMELIDSNTYKKALSTLREKKIDNEKSRKKELILIRNFLGGLTNYKIEELYKKIALLKFENTLGYQLKNRDKLVENNSVMPFEKKLDKYSSRLLKKSSV